MTDQDAFQPVESSEFWRIRRACYVVSAALSIVFIAAVCAYGRYGGAFVNGLDDQLGPVVAARAGSLYDSGQPEAAVEMYRKAIQGRFKSSEEKSWACRRLADTLFDLQRWDEAAPAYESSLSLKQRQIDAYPRLCAVYKNLGQKEKMLNAAQRWKDVARAYSEADVKVAQNFIDREAKTK